MPPRSSTRLFPLLAVVAFCTAGVTRAPTAQATVILVAPSGSQADLQAAVDTAAGLTDRAVILLGPGAWELIGTVTVDVDHLTILGAGPSRTLLYRDHEDAAPFLRVQDAVGVRISGLGLRGSTAPASDTLEVGVRVSNAVDFRIDHSSFAFLGNSGIMTQGDTRGVIDHCAFDDIFKDAIGNYGYGVSIYGVGLMEGEPFGSARATFIEDSVLAGCRHATASNNGARYVLRHSLVTANEFSHAIDAHGDEYNSTDAGTEWIDVNHVLVEDPVYTGYAVRIRGGEGLIWSNEILGYGVAVTLTESTPQPTGPVHVWDNTLSAGTTLLNTGAGAEGLTTAPAGYVPYRYPHPLVDDLVAAAGPDGRYPVEAGGGPAAVFLDARASTVSEGSVVATRWYLGDQLLSTCAVDVQPLPAGQHLILLEVERDDGLLEHDLSVVEVLDGAGAGDLVSTDHWPSLWFVPLVGQGTVELDVTPAASPMDGYVALTGRFVASDHPDLAVILRMNNLGFFDVRDGAVYASDAAIPYEAGQPYHVRIDVDVPAQTYDVRVDGALLASGYDFRLPVAELGQLVAWHFSGGVAATGLTVTGDHATPDPPCIPDAGLPDGGVDAAAPVVDASVPADADVPGPDGGSPPPDGAEAGCGCQAHGAGSSPAAALGLFGILGLFGLWRRRRSRRRSRHRCPSQHRWPRR